MYLNQKQARSFESKSALCVEEFIESLFLSLPVFVFLISLRYMYYA